MVVLGYAGCGAMDFDAVKSINQGLGLTLVCQLSLVIIASRPLGQSVFSYIYVYIYICRYIYTYICRYIYIPTCTYIYIYIHVGMCGHVHGCMCLTMNMHTHACDYVCVYSCIVDVMKMGKIVPTTGIEPTSIVFQTCVLTNSPPKHCPLEL